MEGSSGTLFRDSQQRQARQVEWLLGLHSILYPLHPCYPWHPQLQVCTGQEFGFEGQWRAGSVVQISQLANREAAGGGQHCVPSEVPAQP